MSLLAVDRLSKICPDGFAIDGISFEVQANGIYGFFGKKGSGKTLLASLLCGICDADAGEISYKGTNILASEKNANKAKRKLGYVPERCPFPTDMTVSEVLDFTGMAKGVLPDKRARQIKEALTLIGLDKKADVLIDSLTPSEKKRVAYANALIGNPDVIIIDEPLAIIDAAQKEETKKILAMLGKMKAVLVFSKNPTEIEELCDHVAILSCGRLPVYESVQSMFEKLSGTLSALLRVRLGGVSTEALFERLGAIEEIDDLRECGTVASILDIKIDCSVREGVAEKVYSALEELGAEVVSLKFSDLSISDVMEALCAQEKEA